MSEPFYEIESGRYCPDCVGAEYDGTTWRWYRVADMLTKAEEWRDVPFDEFTPPEQWEGWRAKQWREWGAILRLGGGFIHRLYRSTTAPARVVAFMEDVEF